jgi:hypothetical protein
MTRCKVKISVVLGVLRGAVENARTTHKLKEFTTSLPANSPVSPMSAKEGSRSVVAPRNLRANPSFEARPNGIALGPRGALVHHAPRGPSAIPSVPPQLER